MIGHLGEFGTQIVSERGFIAAGGAHLVRLVHDDQIPMAAEQAFLGVLDARHPGYGCDDLIFVLPRIGTVVGPKNVAADDLKVLPEFILYLALPMGRRRGGTGCAAAP